MNVKNIFQVFYFVNLKTLSISASLLIHVFILFLFYVSISKNKDINEDKRSASSLKIISIDPISTPEIVQQKKIIDNNKRIKFEIKKLQKVNSDIKNDNIVSEKITLVNDVNPINNVFLHSIDSETVNSIYSLVMNVETDLSGFIIADMFIDDVGNALNCALKESNSNKYDGNFLSYNNDLCKLLIKIIFRKNKYFIESDEKSFPINIIWVKDRGVWIMAGNTTASFDKEGMPVSLNEIINEKTLQKAKD